MNSKLTSRMTPCFMSQAGSRISLLAPGLALLVIVAMVGCGGDDQTGPNNHLNDPRFPVSADVLMTNFRDAYGGMDLALYRKVLHGSYAFVFQQMDVEHLGLPSDKLLRPEEVQVADNMFNAGGPIPISQINIEFLDPQTPWQDTGPDHPYFPNTSRRVFAISLDIARPGGTTLMITGLQEFFAVGRDSFRADGTPAEYWQLIGQIDRTEGAGGRKAGVESTTWGGVKNMYR